MTKSITAVAALASLWLSSWPPVSTAVVAADDVSSPFRRRQALAFDLQRQEATMWGLRRGGGLRMPKLGARRGDKRGETTSSIGETTSTQEPSSAAAGEQVAASASAATSALAKTVSTTTTEDDAVNPLQETNKEDDRNILTLIRFLFLFYYGSLGSLMPYLPVYYHSIGHGGHIIGLLGAVKPFTTFLVAPVWGMIADETQRPFFILQVTFLVSLLGQLAVSWRKDATYIMFMVFLTALFNAPVKSLIDSMVMDHISDQSSYGRLRLWGQMGFGLASSGVGVLLSRSHHVPWPDKSSLSEEFLAKFPISLQSLLKFLEKCWRSMTGYKLLFLTHAVLSIPTWLLIQAFRRMDAAEQAKQKQEQVAAEGSSSSTSQEIDATETTKKKPSNIAHGLFLLFHNADALFFFFLVFVVGVSSGVIENFAYVRLREVGGSGKAMGMSRLVSSLAGAPMFWFSGPLTQALGADRVIVASLLSYVTRFCIYASMRNPYHGLPAEALRGVTFAAFWSTGTIYAHRVSPPGLHATMLMLLNAMYGGLGQSLGAIIGGKLQHRFGTVKTFWYAAAVDASFVAAVVAYLSFRKESSFKDPKPIEAPTTTRQQKAENQEAAAN